MNKTVGFGYGALCDNLEKQANEQGYTLGEKEKDLEELKFSLNMVFLNGLIPNSQIEKGFQKLNKKVIASLKPL